MYFFFLDNDDFKNNDMYKALAHATQWLPSEHAAKLQIKVLATGTEHED